ncbi:hypothetical protein MXB_2630 [Myxobolus squamalis]|nr:hypothetical protein MXB_2630 [Myxobolus squamalis]
MLFIQINRLLCEDKSNLKDIRLIGKHICRKPIVGIGEFSSARTYTVNQIGIQSMDLWLIPNNTYFNICKNATTLFNSAGFTIPTKRQVTEKICQKRGDQSKENNPCLIDGTY